MKIRDRKLFVLFIALVALIAVAVFSLDSQDPSKPTTTKQAGLAGVNKLTGAVQTCSITEGESTSASCVLTVSPPAPAGSSVKFTLTRRISGVGAYTWNDDTGYLVGGTQADIMTSNGTASQTLTIPEGATSVRMPIIAIPDTVSELDEVAVATISDPVGVSLSSATTVSITVVDSVRTRICNPTNYGATLNNANDDDAAALQSAINCAQASPGRGVVQIPVGQLDIMGSPSAPVLQIDPRSGISIIGSGPTSIVKVKNGACPGAANPNNKCAHQVFTTGQWYNEVGNSLPLVFDNFAIDGNRQNASGPWSNWESEQAHFIFIGGAILEPGQNGGSSTNAGRVIAYVQNMTMRNGTGDALSIGAKTDVTAWAGASTDVFRGGLTATGGASKIRARRWDTFSTTVFKTGIDIEIDGPARVASTAIPAGTNPYYPYGLPCDGSVLKCWDFGMDLLYQDSTIDGDLDIGSGFASWEAFCFAAVAPSCGYGSRQIYDNITMTAAPITISSSRPYDYLEIKNSRLRVGRVYDSGSRLAFLAGDVIFRDTDLAIVDEPAWLDVSCSWLQTNAPAYVANACPARSGLELVFQIAGYGAGVPARVLFERVSAHKDYSGTGTSGVAGKACVFRALAQQSGTMSFTPFNGSAGTYPVNGITVKDSGPWTGFDNGVGPESSNCAATGYAGTVSVIGSGGSPTTTTSPATTTIPTTTTTTTTPAGLVTYDDAAAQWTFSPTAAAEADGWVQYGPNLAAADGNYASGNRTTNKTGATATITFNGTNAQLLGSVGPQYGKFTVAVDGGAASSPIDAYAATWLPQQSLWTSGTLSAGSHTIVVTTTGTKNASSSNYYVVVDAITVTGSTATTTTSTSTTIPATTTTTSATTTTTTPGAPTLLWSDEFDSFDPTSATNVRPWAQDDPTWQNVERGYTDFAGPGTWNANKYQTLQTTDGSPSSALNPFSQSAGVLTITNAAIPTKYLAAIRASMNEQGQGNVPTPSRYGGTLVMNRNYTNPNTGLPLEITSGYVETRVRFPDFTTSTAAEGLFPGVFLYASQGASNPSNKGRAELDMAESFGWGSGSPWTATAHAQNSYGAEVYPSQEVGNATVSPASWHRLGVEWKRSIDAGGPLVRFYLDGVAIGQVSGAMAGWFDTPMAMRFTFASDAYWFPAGRRTSVNTAASARMEIDYVRWYSGLPATVTPPSSTTTPPITTSTVGATTTTTRPPTTTTTSGTRIVTVSAFRDSNGNGVKNAGEGSLGGTRARIRDSAGRTILTVTLATAAVQLVVPTGTYSVLFIPPAGANAYTATTVNLPASGNATVTFGGCCPRVTG